MIYSKKLLIPVDALVTLSLTLSLALSGEKRLRLGKAQASFLRPFGSKRQAERALLSACTVLTLTIPFALCADVVAEHGTEDEVLFGCELV